jgi:hypothetical protein
VRPPVPLPDTLVREVFQSLNDRAQYREHCVRSWFSVLWAMLTLTN